MINILMGVGKGGILGVQTPPSPHPKFKIKQFYDKYCELNLMYI